MTGKRLFVIAAVFGCLLAATPAPAQLAALKHDPARIPVGTVFHFRKSQRDGAHATNVSVYVAAVDRVEGLKWDEAADSSTLVKAWMDWSNFSVRRFEAWQLERGAAPALAATMHVTGSTLNMSLMPAPLTLSHFPWHSFDFDYTSLGLTVPQLVDPKGSFTFWRTDFVYTDPPVMAEIGAVTLRFEKMERRDGRRVRRYSLGGPGMQGKTGTWWADAKTGLLVAFDAPLGDEPGYDSVRLERLSTTRMTAEQWLAFQKKP